MEEKGKTKGKEVEQGQGQGRGEKAGWSTSASEREDNLRRRKEKLVLEARRCVFGSFAFSPVFLPYCYPCGTWLMVIDP